MRRKNMEVMGNRLHLQFGHASFNKLRKLIEEGLNNKMGPEKLKKMLIVIEESCENCAICKKYKRTPARPVVGLPLGKDFNDVVAMDLGEIEGNRFLLIIDTATHYIQAGWIKNKTPEEVTKGFVRNWIKTFGAPKKILSDNGLEFQNEEMKIITEAFSVEQWSTAAESPFSNGLCEKAVGLLKDKMRRLREDIDDKNLVIDWAVSAHNCLSVKGGFSPNQLVFGRNPNLPNVWEDATPSALENNRESVMIRKLLQALHKSRETQIQQESSERIKRALSHKIRDHNLESVEMGEKVYYKREGEQNWRGPATVVGRVGKTVIVKHGGTLREIARVHITRTQKGTTKKEKGGGGGRNRGRHRRCGREGRGRFGGDGSKFGRGREYW